MARELLQDIVAEKLIQEITSGRRPVGSTLPGEHELAASFGVSRSTVRAALARLSRHGMISRTPHTGTKVISRGKTSSFDRRLSTFSDLNRLASANVREIRDVREIVVSREMAGSLGWPPGETLIRFSMVRLGARQGELPIAWTQEYVGRGMQELVTEAPKHPDVLMITLIGRIYGKRCTEVRQTVEATTLSEEAAAQLESTPGEPCLMITRRYLGARGRAFLVTVSCHPADRYAFNLNFRLDDGE